MNNTETLVKFISKTLYNINEIKALHNDDLIDLLDFVEDIMEYGHDLDRISIRCREFGFKDPIQLLIYRTELKEEINSRRLIRFIQA